MYLLGKTTVNKIAWIKACNGFVATHAHDVCSQIASNNEPKSAQQAKQGAWYK